MKHITIALFTVVLVFTFASSLQAQATAEISGVVKDATGAALPGVEITATQTATGQSRSAITNEIGLYVLPTLPLGPYRLEASLPGFRTYVQSGIVLQINSSWVSNIILEVGQVTEQVEVQACELGELGHALAVDIGEARCAAGPELLDAGPIEALQQIGDAGRHGGDAMHGRG